MWGGMTDRGGGAGQGGRAVCVCVGGGGLTDRDGGAGRAAPDQRGGDPRSPETRAITETDGGKTSGRRIFGVPFTGGARIG